MTSPLTIDSVRERDDNKTMSYGRELERIYILFVNTLLLARIPSLSPLGRAAFSGSHHAISGDTSVTNNTNPIVGFGSPMMMWTLSVDASVNEQETRCR